MTQSIAHGAEDRTMHRRLIAKAHFRFGGMNVHIDLTRIDLDEQHDRWMPTWIDQPSIRLFYRVRDRTIRNEAAVEEDPLMLGRPTGDRGFADHPPNTQSTFGNVHPTAA